MDREPKDTGCADGAGNLPPPLPPEEGDAKAQELLTRLCAPTSAQPPDRTDARIQASKAPDEPGCNLLGQGFRGLTRFLYTHNPFYLASAACMIYGLYVAFSTSRIVGSGWWLLGLMTGYTLLMAATAWLVVRLGKVWNDARTILLVVMLLFLASAVSLDEMGIQQTREMAVPLVLSALFCALGISRGILTSMKMRFGLLYEGPYYVILSLFFLYPLGIMLLQEYGNPSDTTALTLAMLAFPLATALAFLLLVPAIRRGADYVANNGTPWRWPVFPLVVFFLLALAVGPRVYFMSLSFMPVEGMDSPFGLYWLTPMLLAVAVLLLEMERVTGWRGVRVTAMLLPALAVVLSFPGKGGSAVYQEAVGVVLHELASPVLLTLAGAALVYLYAWRRGVAGAEAGLVTALLMAGFIRLDTVDLRTLGPIQPWGFAAAGAVEAIQAIRRRSSWRTLFAAIGGILTLTLLAHERYPHAGVAVMAAHAAMASAMVVGLLFKDRFAKALQILCCFLPIALVFAAMIARPAMESAWTQAIYGLLVIAGGVLYWRLTGLRLCLGTTLTAAGIYVLNMGWLLYHALQSPSRPKGLVAVFWGALFFIVALLISLAKGGVLRRRPTPPAPPSPPSAGGGGECTGALGRP